MIHLLSRLYEGEKDIQTILDLISRIRPPKYLYNYPVKTDIEENLASAATRADTRLWFDHNRPVGWAYVDEFNNLSWELDSQYEEWLGTDLVEWGEACIRKKLTNGRRATLDTNCREDYEARISFLSCHGFAQSGETNVFMSRDLSQPIPEPNLPPGFVIRSIAGAQEAEAVASTHRAAFGTDYMTTENRLIIMNTSDYDPSLDLVVTAPDGTIAANCICSANPISKTGSTDPVLTHPSFQRLGLARALLFTGLRHLKERNMSSAHLGTSGYNLAMQQTAMSAGFRIAYKTLWFSKEVKQPIIDVANNPSK
jgi:mycothiol synthase